MNSFGVEGSHSHDWEWQRPALPLIADMKEPAMKVPDLDRQGNHMAIPHTRLPWFHARSIQDFPCICRETLDILQFPTGGASWAIQIQYSRAREISHLLSYCSVWDTCFISVWLSASSCCRLGREKKPALWGLINSGTQTLLLPWTSPGGVRTKVKGSLAVSTPSQGLHRKGMDFLVNSLPRTKAELPPGQHSWMRISEHPRKLQYIRGCQGDLMQYRLDSLLGSFSSFV